MTESPESVAVIVIAALLLLWSAFLFSPSPRSGDADV
jgi:hypothetical protein